MNCLTEPSFDGIDDGGALVVLLRGLGLVGGDHQVLLHGFPVHTVFLLKNLTFFLSVLQMIFNSFAQHVLVSFLQCCGSGMFIQNPGSEFFHSGYRVKIIPDPGSASKKYF